MTPTQQTLVHDTLHEAILTLVRAEAFWCGREGDSQSAEELLRDVRDYLAVIARAGLAIALAVAPDCSPEVDSLDTLVDSLLEARERRRQGRDKQQ